MTRSKRIRDYIRLSSGDGDEAFTTQTAHVVKSLDETTRKSIVSNLNIKTTIPTEHVAANEGNTKYSLEFIGRSTPLVGNFQCQTFHKKQSLKVAKEWVEQGLKCEYATTVNNEKEEVRNETNTMVLPI